MRCHSGSASAALASFIAQAGIFEGPTGLLVFNEPISIFVSLVVIYRNLKHFLGADIGGMLFVCCKPMNSPRVENL